MRRDSPRLDYSELIVNGADHSRAVYPCAPRNVNRAGICPPFPKLHPALSVLGPGWFSSCSNLLGEGLVAAFRHPSSVFPPSGAEFSSVERRQAAVDQSEEAQGSLECNPGLVNPISTGTGP